MASVTLNVTGMTCGSCRRHVHNALAAIPQVDSVKVDLASGTADVSSSTAVGVAALVEAVREAGYNASPVESSNRGLPVATNKCSCCC